MAVPRKLVNTAVGEAVYNKEYVDFLESLVVKLSGNQSISGIKTFGASPIVPTPTEPTQVVNKQYADSILGSFATPDYARKESTNRINANNGTWTADRNGYVNISLVGTSTATTNAWYYVTITINEKDVVNKTQLTNQVGTIQDTYLLAVKVGDVVKITYTVGTNLSVTTLRCYFIPVVSNNFNVFSDYSGSPAYSSTINLPSNPGTSQNLFTAPQDGEYFIVTINTPNPIFNTRVTFYVNSNPVSIFPQDTASFANLRIKLTKGDVVSVIMANAGASSWQYKVYPMRVSVAGASQSWIEYTGTNAVTPSSAMTFANAANAVLRYNPSLGIISLSLNSVNISTITDQTVLGTYSANVPLLSKVNFVEGDCHYPLYGFKIELRKNSRNIYFRNMANNTGSVFNNVYFNDVIGYV